MLGVALVFLALVCIRAEVSVLSKVQALYDRSPKLRIKLTGITDVDASTIKVVIGPKGQDPLLVDKDYTLTKDADGDVLVLQLVAGRKYVQTMD
jgi:hypothetical protein